MKPGLSLLALLACALAAQARIKDTISLQPGAPVTITVGCCFNNLAFSGYAPLDVTISNHSGQARQWVFDFASPAYNFGAFASVESSFAISVEDNTTRTLPLLVPMGPELTMSGLPPLKLHVSGYGTDSSSQDTFTTGQSNGKNRTAPVAISIPYGTAILNKFGETTDDNNDAVAVSTFEPAELPADWRGLSGFSTIWMAGDQLNHLSPAQREAVRTWMRSGGRLHLFLTAAPPPDFAFAGFGGIDTQSAVPDAKAVSQIAHDAPHYNQRFEVDGLHTEPELVEVRPNAALLLGFMGLFSVVVGPINFFVLARRRRERLFWTTPLISIVASAVLGTLIVARDGLGGHGLRSAVVCVFPDSQTEVVRQQQVSRTGLLMGSTFETPLPLLLAEQSVSTAGLPVDMTNRRLQVDGNRYSGEWFTTRAAQQQGLIAVKPAYGQIGLSNAEAVQDKEAVPVIFSGIPVQFDQVYFTDGHRRHWQAINLAPGAPETMKPAEDNVRFAEKLGLQYYEQPNYFVAIANYSPDYISTLDSILWSDLAVTYILPATNTP